MPCTVCGVGSKRTVRECVGLGGGGTQRSWISWKGEKKIRIILYVCWCGVSGDTA